MRLHRLAASLVALLVAALLPLGGGVTPTWAAAQRPAPTSARRLPATSLTNKVILPDTSIDGPALASIGTESVIGWTGTDAAHRLNVETSSDGLHFANKLILNETPPFRPDVALASQGGAVAVAWTGSDANHSLNVLYDVYGSSLKKLTLRDENSFTAPALLIGPGFSLAWTGTDANHSLNFLPITIQGNSLVPGTKQILSQFSSNAGPHLSSGGQSTVLNWTSRTLQPKVAVANLPDVPFGLVATLPESSAFAPDTFFNAAVQGPPVWISWTGTDAAHHLNVQFTTTYPAFPNPKSVLPELALGGPALAFNAGNQLAWTGTDAQHHLNVAKFA